MMSLLLLIIVCLLSLLVLIGVIVGMIVVMRSNQRDAVSTARENWIRQRSEKDEKG